MAFDGQPRAGPSYGGKSDAYPNGRATGGVFGSALASAYWTARNKSRTLWVQPTAFQGTSFATSSDGQDWVVATDYIKWAQVSVYVPDEVTHLRCSMRFEYMARIQSTAYLKLTATDAVAATTNVAATVGVSQQVPITRYFGPNTVRDFAEFRRAGAYEVQAELNVKALTSAAQWTLLASVYARSDDTTTFDDTAIRPLSFTCWTEVRETT